MFLDVSQIQSITAVTFALLYAVTVTEAPSSKLFNTRPSIGLQTSYITGILLSDDRQIIFQ